MKKIRYLILLATFLPGACGENATGVVDPQVDAQVVRGPSAEGIRLGPTPSVFPVLSDVSPQLSLVSTSAAGEVILPAAFATKMGAENNVFPHSVPDMRYQQVFLGSEIGGPRSLGGLCLRPDDEWESLGGVTPVTVKLGATDHDPSTLGASFDGNYSSPPTTVFSGDFVLPASGFGGVSDWNACIQFSTPYLHLAGNLLVEILSTSAVVHTDYAADFCYLEPGCTTTRVVALSASATSADFVWRNTGLVMRFLSARPESIVGDLVLQIETLVADGILAGGQGTSLTTQLAKALQKATVGQIHVAINLTNAFINHVNDLTLDGVLPPEDGQPLIDQAAILVELWSAMM